MKVEVKMKNLKDLIEALSGDPKVRVGVLGDSNKRGDGLSNATIGSFHEFGLGVPQRSFLRRPLIDNMDKAVEKSVVPEDLEIMTETRSLVPFMEKLGVIAEQVVQEAFDTGGNGKWPKWITPGYTNNTGMLLVDTQQLRNSISSEVIDV